MAQKNDLAFRLKASFYPVTVIKFYKLEQQSILQQLNEIQQKAPNYFQNSPVIIDVTHVKHSSKNLDLATLSQLLRDHRMIPVGVQGLPAAEIEAATKLGLALWHSSIAETKEMEEEPTPVAHEISPAKNPNLIITKPVRSGMRVYARQCNLVLLAPVSSGAECIADGDIFCYAPVRGRILAGANGDLNAQIFCPSLEAELIAIAGFYLLYDECPPERNGSFQILLKESKLYIHNFSLERSVLCQK